MNSKYWQSARIVVLGCCSLGIMFAVGINLFAKASIDKSVKPLAFQKWEEINTNKIELGNKKIEGWRKRKENNDNLITEVYYIPNYLHGNKELIRQYREIKPDKSDANALQIAVVENKFGFYGLSTHNEKMHLNTCMYPQGKIAFSQSQIADLANENMYSRLVPWIFGLEDLRDWDCFWVNMSVSLENINETEAFNLLDTQLSTLATKIAR